MTYAADCWWLVFDAPSPESGLPGRPRRPLLARAPVPVHGGAALKGPAVFVWNEHQRADLEALWRDPAAEDARERLAKDRAAFCDDLGWSPDATMLADAPPVRRPQEEPFSAWST